MYCCCLLCQGNLPPLDALPLLVPAPPPPPRCRCAAASAARQPPLIPACPSTAPCAAIVAVRQQQDIIGEDQVFEALEEIQYDVVRRGLFCCWLWLAGAGCWWLAWRRLAAVQVVAVSRLWAS